jgi:hypothetical protein
MTDLYSRLVARTGGGDRRSGEKRPGGRRREGKGVYLDLDGGAGRSAGGEGGGGWGRRPSLER